MLERIKTEFPELYTKTGKFSKKEPKKYKCECGHLFNRTRKATYGGIGFGFAICDECGARGKHNLAHGIWKRMIHNQIEQEDFLLKTVRENKEISKESLVSLAENEFEDYSREALGYLCYFGYFNVRLDNTTGTKKVNYFIPKDIDTESRYQMIY